MRDIRINNIELRYSDFNHQYEILKKSPNPLYGKESEFEKDGDSYIRNFEGMPVRYSKSCFEHPESGYLLAWFEETSEKDVKPDVTWCMGRPLELSSEDFNDFIDIIKFAYNDIEKEIGLNREAGD